MKQSMMWKRTLSTLGLMAALSLLLFAFSVRPAAAAGIVVNSAADDIDAFDGDCTLREAIIAANNDTPPVGPIGECAAGSGADTITFAADYTITLAGSQLPAVTTEMTITGNGAANTIIQANAAANTATYRVFEVGDPGNLTLDGVTVRHGVCAGACAAPASSGGGIYNTGTATVTNSTISSNSAQDNGGGIYNTFGPLTVTNSTLSGNSAASEGGGIFSFGIATVTNSTLSGNSADLGGGIFNSTGGTLTVTNSTLTGNSANFSGGIHNNFGGWLTVTRSLVSGNSAGAGDEVLNNSGTITVDANNVFGHSGQTNADAFDGFVPGATDFNATQNGTPTALTDILDTTLADNGGPTETHALVAGSPAIDLGPTADCAAAPVNGLDQRGEPRNIDGDGNPTANECDAGAYEYSGPPAFCTGFPMLAGTEAELNEAITCYNLLVAAGSYTINLTFDIPLTASTVAIDNPIAGIELLLDGQGFTVDGQGTLGVRPFEIETDSDATFDDITITGGNISDDGGGIFNDGTLTVTNSTLSGNAAGDRGGGIFNRDGALIVTNSTLSGNSAVTGGGGIFNRFGTLMVTGSTLSSNSTLGDGGSIYNDEGTTTVTSSTLSGNEADSGSGGGIYNNSGTTTVADSILSGNKAISDFGGGIYNQVGTLDVSNSTLSGNEAVNGGGIFNRDGTTTVTDSTLSGNPAGDRGGGIFTRDGTVTVANSTFSGNSATNEGGGGIYINGGDLTVTNSTLSGNSAPLGGGIYNDGGTTTVTNATFYGNQGGLAPGASIKSTSATNLMNSLLTGSVNGDECNGVTADASNIDDDDSCDSATQKTVGEINLDTTLTDNGGPTFTHALLPGSAAIDFDTTVSCAAAPVNGVDQRGEPRNVDGNGAASANECDAGAYEYGGPPAFCTGFPMSAGTESQLNEAITCYNLLAAAGSYTINLTFDIPLTASTVAIDNPIAGIELLLDGQGFAVNGQGTLGVRPFEIKADSDATFDDITITRGNVSNDGGGILNAGTLTVTNSALSGNSADFGGGIRNEGTLTVTNSTLSKNGAAFGGGIWSSGMLTVTNSTLRGNEATASGGGIRSTGTLTVTNSTLSGNKARGGSGGGISSEGPLTVTNSTLSGNSAGTGGGIYNDESPLTVTNSLFVKGEDGANCDGVSGAQAGASNIDDDGTCGDAAQKTTAAIALGPLADNGGPTQTHALLPGSAAIDFDTTASCAAAPVNGLDKRGESRSIDIPGTGDDGGANLCDTGAFEVQLPAPIGFCPVDPNVGLLMTDLLGAGQGSAKKGVRTRKLVIPNYQDVDSLYGQLASVESGGVMKYVRFLYPNGTKEQVYAPTSPAYRTFAVNWWGSELETGHKYIKGQFFWGAKGSKTPRAFVLWPTYSMTEEYANVFTTFGESIENHVAWEAGFIPSQTQTIAIPETQAAGATVTVRFAIVDNDKDGRPVDIDVTVGSQTQSISDMVPNAKDTLNLYELTFENVEAGVDEVMILLESPDGTGDSAAIIGAAVSYACEVPAP